MKGSTTATAAQVTTCPLCHAQDSLVLLGDRRDHPHRWMPWATTTMHVYLCGACDEIVTVDVAHERAPLPLSA